jgi:adenylylsulfate kinase-like enzyme
VAKLMVGAGLIPNFTGLDSPYEVPEAPELHLRTDGRTPAKSAGVVLAWLRDGGILDGTAGPAGD